MDDSIHHGSSGFTLLELLVSMAVGIIVLGAMVSTFLIQRKSYATQEQVTQLNQNARAAMDLMSREIRMAGYRVEGIDAISEDSNSSKIAFLGDVDSDVITAIDTNPANASETSISVNLRDNGDYIAESDYIYISDGIHSELIHVDETEAFSTSGEPDTINLREGLANSYAVGSLVQTVEEVTYELDGTTLERNGYPVAENIESLNFTYGANTVTIRLTARTSKIDPGLPGDGYRRKTLTTTVMLRNR